MKRRILSMDTSSLSNQTGILVERNTKPQGVELISPYAVGRRDPNDLVSLAQEIQKADSFVQATTCSKLQIIAEQVRFLQQQAHRILQEAKESIDLHHAACNFLKQPGNIYYLYQRPSGQYYFSMLSPQDWESQGGPPHSFSGTYRLEKDMSWTPESKFTERSDSQAVIKKILNMNSPASITYEEVVKPQTEPMDNS